MYPFPLLAEAIFQNLPCVCEYVSRQPFRQCGPEISRRDSLARFFRLGTMLVTDRRAASASSFRYISPNSARVFACASTVFGHASVDVKWYSWAIQLMSSQLLDYHEYEQCTSFALISMSSQNPEYSYSYS